MTAREQRALEVLERHPLRLVFEDPTLEAEFRTEYARASLPRHRQVSWLALLLWLGFVPIEVWMDGRYTVSVIRLAVGVPALIAAIAIGYASFDRFRRYWQAVVATSFAAQSVAVVAMALVVAEPERAKDLGFGACIVLLSGHLMLLLRFSIATVISVGLIIAFAVTSATVGLSTLDYASGVAWLLCALGVGMLGSSFLEHHRRKEFLQARLIESERARSEALLLNVLPESIARRLQHEPGPIADTFADVTVLFGDLVGFTTLSARLRPEALVRALDEVFSAFDDAAQRHGLEKIKTIGDAYMVVGGVPTAREDHAAAVARMALEMAEVVARFRAPDGETLGMRIGIHTGGPVVAGVIGKKKFIYDIWGDTVNTASRMESHGEAGRIHVSDAVRARLEGDARFILRSRGAVDVKGKGPMHTFWLEAGDDRRDA